MVNYLCFSHIVPYPWGPTATHENANYGTDTVAGIGFASGPDKWVATSPVGSSPRINLDVMICMVTLCNG